MLMNVMAMLVMVKWLISVCVSMDYVSIEGTCRVRLWECERVGERERRREEPFELLTGYYVMPIYTILLHNLVYSY